MVGVAGLVLAVILVMGQVSLATSKGMAVHLHNSVEHISQGNVVMESIVERTAPATALETILKKQTETLASTRNSLAQTNADLDAIITAKHGLIDVVDGMQSTSGALATDVGALGSSTTRMTSLLGELPDSTARTHKQLNRINTDTNAINAELAAIGRKMMSYGLPRAKGAPTG